MAKIDKPNKYKAKKIEIDGIKFDSIAEGDYYLYLKECVKLGKIDSFELQPTYTLQEKFCHKMSGSIRAIVYKADFRVYKNNCALIIDVKGKSTPVALLKRKMFLKRYAGLELRWVVKSKKYSETGWIDYFELLKIRRENRNKKKLKQYVYGIRRG